MTDKIYGLLGLCQRAGKCKSGEFAVEKSIKSGKSFLVIIPEDASDNTETLGHQLGRSERSSISIEDQGFAQAMIKYIDGGNVNVR